jgi:hypothetical protein
VYCVKCSGAEFYILKGVLSGQGHAMTSFSIQTKGKLGNWTQSPVGSDHHLSVCKLILERKKERKKNSPFCFVHYQQITTS